MATKTEMTSSMQINRRAALALTAGATIGLMMRPGTGRAQASKIFRFAPHTALRVLDPISTSAYVTRDHAYLVYDQLFSFDADYVPRPQMVDTWEIRDDRLAYTFRLRDGLNFHDGSPVTAEDCVASIKRWTQRDIIGRRLADVTKAMTAVDDQTFRIELNEPFGIMLSAMAKISSVPLFIMPKRVASTPPEQALEEVIGSGPYKWIASEFKPGVRWVYERNEDYVPRDEPPSGLAGGKVVHFDRFESIYFPNMQTALNALQRQEIDAVETFGADQLSIVAGDPNVVTHRLSFARAPLIRFNWAQPPFDDVMARRAVQAAVTQRDYLEAAVGDEAHFEVCQAIFGCGTPLDSDVGVVDTGHPDLEKAKSLLSQSKYAGETIVLLNPGDLASFQPHAAMTHQILTSMGMKVALEAPDWNTYLQRRSMTGPVSEGGWNITHIIFDDLDLASPLTNMCFDARGKEGYAGFIEDPKTESLKSEFQRASTDEERKAIAEELQRRAYDQVFYIPLGYYYDYSATRPGLEPLKAPLFVGWGIGQ